MPKLTPEELLRSIETAPTSPEEDTSTHGEPDPFDAAVAEVLAMTPEERRRELEAAGVDVEALHAETAEFLGREYKAAAAPAPQAAPAVLAEPPIPITRERKAQPIFLWVAAAAAVAILVAAAVFFREPSPPPPQAPPAPTEKPTRPPPGPDIASLRRDAVEACGAMRWQVCQDSLDALLIADPTASHDRNITLMRTQAMLALHPGDGGASPSPNAKQPELGPGPARNAPR